MQSTPPEKASKRRWGDTVAFVAAVAVSLPVISGVRALTSEHIGLAGGTLAGLACALLAVGGVYMVVNRLPGQRD